jgi:hypothetical protein
MMYFDYYTIVQEDAIIQTGEELVALIPISGEDLNK